MINDPVKLANPEWTSTNDEWANDNGVCTFANDKFTCEIAGGPLLMANNLLQMVNGPFK